MKEILWMDTAITVVMLACLNLTQESLTLSSNEQMIHNERDHERIRIEQRFNDMNPQNGELISLLRMLSEEITSSNKEENDSNAQRSRKPSHFDTESS